MNALEKNGASLIKALEQLAVHDCLAYDLMCVAGMDGYLKYVNPAWERTLGHSKEEFLSRPFLDFVHPEDHAKAVEELRKLASGGQVVDLELHCVHRNGTLRTVSWTATPLPEEGLLYCVGRDITERKQAEERLRKSEEFIRNILETVDEGFIVVDRDLRIISANRAFFDKLRMTPQDVIGKQCYAVSHRIGKPCYEVGENCAVRRTFETGKPHTALHTHFDAAGVPVYVEIKSYPLHDSAGTVVSAIETINDITEKRMLEEQLRHSQKLEAIGTLAGGVAHDFNNILAAIIGYGSLLRMKMDPVDPLRPNVDRILESANRAAHLTQGLLTFSRKQIISVRPLNIHAVVGRVHRLLGRIIGEDIRVDIRPGDTDLTVMADSGQLEQVLMNLATNARDAMPSGGVLTILASKIAIDDGFIKAHGYGKPGPYALITVTDTGCGMEEKNLRKIFEPFFTTKEAGTGLGLAMAYGIVKQHNGYINVYSETGKGTTFKIYLPLIDTHPREQDAALSEPRFSLSGTETILLAEDDPTILKLTATILTEFGYRVITAGDGHEAVRKFEENKDSVRLVLLDVVMPVMSGTDAAEAIQKIKPDTRVIFQSGYPSESAQIQRRLDATAHFLYKPISPQDLLKKVRAVLDTEDRSSLSPAGLDKKGR